MGVDTTTTLLNALENLKVLFSTDVSKSNFIGFTFKKNTDLRKMVELVNVGLNEKRINTIDDINTVTTEILEKIEQLNNPLIFGLIDNVGLGLSQKLVQAIVNIKETIKDEVINLEQIIHDKYITYMKEEGAEELLNGSYEPDTSQLLIFNWDGINSNESNKELLTQLHTFVGLKSKEFSKGNFQYIFRKIASEISSFKSLNIEDNIKELIVANAINYLKNYKSLTEEDIGNLVNVTFDKNTLLSLWNDIRIKINNTSNIAELTVSLLEYSNKINDFLNIRNMNIDISSLDKFYSNLDTLDLVAKLIKYHCIIIKNTIFKDKVILNNRIINGPVLKKVEKEGKTLKDIIYFIRAVYNNKVPNYGVSSAAIINKNIDKFIEQYKNKLEVKSNYIKSKCINRAFVNVLRRYYSNIAVLMGLDEETEEYKKNKAKWYTFIDSNRTRLTGNIEKLNGVLYDVLINFIYPNSLTSQLYSVLSKAYDKLIDQTEEDTITDETILTTELEIVADIMINHLLTNYCVVGKI